MKKRFSLVISLMFLVVLAQFAVAQQWPAGEWQTAVIATTDDVHKAEAGVDQKGNVFTIKAGGDDIWGSADQFTYIYKEVSGDFDVAATIISLENTNDWAKAGIMARQDLSPGAMNVMCAPRGANDLVTFQRREVADSDSASERVTPDGASFPVTVRLTRTGNEFMGGWSLDGGATWEDNVTRDGVTPTPPAVVEFTDPILLGIAVTSHEAGVITTAEVEILGDVISAVTPDLKLPVTWATIRTDH